VSGTSLRELQAQLWSAVRAPLLESESRFRGSEDFPAPAGLEVYRAAYWVRQVRALAEIFPYTEERINALPMTRSHDAWDMRFPTAFSRLTMLYVREAPSREFALERMGARFPEWLTRAPLNTLEVHQAKLSLLAAFEFACWEVSVAPNGPRIEASAASAPGFEQSVLWCGSHVQVLRIPFRFLQEISPKLAHGGVEVRDDANVAVAVWRDGFRIRHTRLSFSEHVASSLALNGACVVDLCAALQQEGDAAFIHRTLHTWFNRGWITRLQREEQAGP
jgi:hypothetical protein